MKFSGRIFTSVLSERIDFGIMGDPIQSTAHLTKTDTDML